MSIRSLGSWPLYPFFLALLPALTLYQRNFYELDFAVLARPLVVALLVTGALLALMRLATGGWLRAALPTSVLTHLVLSMGEAAPALQAGALALAVGLVVAMRRWALPTGRINAVFNVAAGVLALLPAVQGGQAARSSRAPVLSTPGPALAPGAVQSGSPLPDIYYIVLDGFGRGDVLSDLYGMGPEALVEPLKRLGFYVAEDSYANYAQTGQSLASSLNMEYLDALLEIRDSESRDRRPLGRLVRDSSVLRILRRAGYSVEAFPSGYSLSRLNGVDRRHRPAVALTYPELVLLNKTAVAPLERLLGKGPGNVAYAARRQKLSYMLDGLSEVEIERSDPTFTFAHLLAPHPPFVFGRSGEALTSTDPFTYRDGDHWHEIHGDDGASYVDQYRDQALYVAERLLPALQRLIAGAQRAGRSLVVIVQSDHGPGNQLAWDHPQRSNLWERMAILNAYYFSDGDYGALYPAISPVNSFRVVLQKQLGMDLAPLPDRVWFSTWRRPYKYVSVGRPQD